ncbi:hypothetical protein ACHAXT_008678 [Thalassiosira profunda]
MMNPTTMAQPSEVSCGRPRGMSAEDEAMFNAGRPFEDAPKATNTPKSTPPTTPAKSPEQETTPLRPISMPEPFKI